MTARIEVRCCCDPSKLLGSIPFSSEIVVLRGSKHLELCDIWVEGDKRKKAYKSNDHPIALLETISGWKPA